MPSGFCERCYALAAAAREAMLDWRQVIHVVEDRIHGICWGLSGDGELMGRFEGRIMRGRQKIVFRFCVLLGLTT